MYSFIPFSILAYALNGGATVIDKILLRTRLPSPFVYTFYIALLGSTAAVLSPFGLTVNTKIIIFSVLAALFGNLALLAFFKALKAGEASVVGPLVGGLNPLFTLFVGVVLLNQTFALSELAGFFMLLSGGAVLTLNIWASGLKLSLQLFMITTSALSFALSSIFLKEAFLAGNFISGLVISRMAATVLVLGFLIPESIRAQIFSSNISSNKFMNKTTGLLLLGQSMGAAFGLLWAYGVFLASPAVVNSFFGVQYLIILAVALILGRKTRNLLDERLTGGIILQKTLGATILSLGVYLLSLSA